MENTETDQIVIKGSIARHLLKNGFVIKDVKPQIQQDGSIDFTRNVFLFEAKVGLKDAIKKLINK